MTASDRGGSGAYGLRPPPRSAARPRMNRRPADTLTKEEDVLMRGRVKLLRAHRGLALSFADSGQSMFFSLDSNHGVDIARCLKCRK